MLISEITSFLRHIILLDNQLLFLSLDKPVYEYNYFWVLSLLYDRVPTFDGIGNEISLHHLFLNNYLALTNSRCIQIQRSLINVYTKTCAVCI